MIDTHAHIYGPEFKEDIADVVRRARQAGVSQVFMPATDIASAEEAAALARQYPGTLYPMLGLHPEDLPDDWRDQLSRMEEILKSPHPFIGIGEVGFDLYWDDSRVAEQTEAFRVQVEWAATYDLPLMIHCRSAQHLLLQVLKDYPKDRLSGVFHCFSGGVDKALQLLEYPRFCLGIGGISTFKRSQLPSVLPSIPLSRIVLETDSPYMTPVPHRGERNEPAYVPYVAAKLAEVYGTTVEGVNRVTTANALRIFTRVSPPQNA
ncbi:MAG: TatD family hydrolase [Prevotellaceae bacterium]|nr:TatD family hydrolase [Prevotellaceae bacterium]MDY3856043.1 TatD family hydrolase [Bacteroidaceae bacterium]